MLSTQLNGGPIANYRPIGHEGQPIYKNAEAFIAALKLHPSVGEKKAQCLAVPRISADGLNIDWYVPFSPKNPDSEHVVVSWNSASPLEQQKALAVLNDLEQSLRKLGLELQRRGAEGQSKLMASYLTGQNSAQNLPAIHFPGPEYVYIVDDVPVITFWGFENPEDDLSKSPLESLRKPVMGGYMPPNQPFANPNPPFGPGAAAAGVGATATAGAMGQVPPNGSNESNGHKCPILGLVLPTWLFRLLLGLIGLGLLLALLWALLPLFGSSLGGLLGCSPSVPETSISAPNSVAEENQDAAADNAPSDGVPADTPVNEYLANNGDGGMNLNDGALEQLVGPETQLSLPNVSGYNIPPSAQGLNFVGMDTNGDGKVDAVDINNDQQPDGPAIDLEEDGNVDAAVFDFNQDGGFEGVGIDTNGDNKLDAIGLDLNGDGQIEALDLNGDGIPDVMLNNAPSDAAVVSQVPVDVAVSTVAPMQPSTETPVFGDDAGVFDEVMSPTEPTESGVASEVLPSDPLPNDPMPGDTNVGLDAPVEPGMSNAGIPNEQGLPLDQGKASDQSQQPNEQQANLPPVDPDFSNLDQGMTGNEPATAQDATAPTNAAQNNHMAANQATASTPAPARPIQGLGGVNVNRNLSFTPNAVQQYGVKVMDGQWNTRSGLMDSTNGKPLQMGYVMKDGQGQVEITRSDGVKCVAPASAQSLNNNGVSIQAASKAVCPDNRSYAIPQIECTSSTDGSVKCKGISGNSSFPIQLYAR